MSWIKNKKNIPFVCFSIIITLFYVFFSKIILKSDDGHFIGILSENGFNLFDWLRYRYETISGRTVCEFLTMVFFSANPIFNKLFFALLWIVFIYLLLKIISSYGQNVFEEKAFVCCMPFLILITCLNSAAVWFSGGFTYLVPFVFMSVALSPLIFDILDIKYKRILLCFLSTVCAFMASSQEQSAALTLAFVCVFIVLLIINKKIKFCHFLPLITSATETYFLFSAPGMNHRTDMEASSFEQFNSLSLVQKVICGFSNYFAFQFLTSIIVSGMFVLLLILTLKRLYSNKKFSICMATVWGIICVCLNVIYIVVNHMLPDKGFEQSFKKGFLNFTDKIMIGAGVLFVVLLLAVIIMIALKDFKTGFAVLLCFGAGICSSVILGFSSSVYSSGQRVFFFSEILMLTASAIMLARLDNMKAKRSISMTACVYSFVMLLIDCFSFTFMETPFMG